MRIFFASLLLLFSLASYGKDYFRKHIIVLIDQTPDVQKNPATQQLYRSLYNGLTGVDADSPLTFDPETDELSLFVFGIEGLWTVPGSPFYNIYNAPNRLAKYDRFTDSFVQYRGRFSDSGQQLGEFLNDKMYPLLSSKDALAEGISNNSGITLSKYAYPAILGSKSITSSKPAEENIILLISNFQSGLNDLGTSADVQRLIELVGRADYGYFEKQFDRLEEPFYKIPLIRAKFEAGDDRLAKPSVYGDKLALKSLQGISAYITSNIDITEKGYNSTAYTIGDVDLSFNHNADALEIDSIVLIISHGETPYYHALMDKDNTYDHLSKSYRFPGKDIDLGHVFDIGDSLSLDYTLYTRAVDSEGKAIMPLVFTASRDYEFGNENITTLMEDRTNMLIAICIALVILAIVVLLMWRLYCKRGKSRKAGFSFSIIPISNERFMEVKGNKVLSYDCWYWAPGDNTDRNIHMIGDYYIEKKRFARKYEYRIEASIQDIDFNEDFTFRPPGYITKNDGSRYLINEWVPIAMIDGKFSYDANAYFDGIERPNFDIDNILQLYVVMRLVMIDKKGVRHELSNMARKYEFIVKPKIKNSDLWVAFDPGTTGSCISYGIAGSPTDRQDLFLAENESETTSDEKIHDNIFPSNIKINTVSEGVFLKGRPAEELVEGIDEDFIFGNQAVIVSRGSNGINSFQSIKKLLGYTTTQKVKGKVTVNGRKQRIEKEMPGQDLAHLLVKGLFNHFEDYLLTNPHIDDSLRKLFLNGTDLLAQRAIVAVPNNYTLIKIQEMVDSVKRTNKFKEVHYIYESEAVFMMYLRENWKSLPEQQRKVFIVYDMGGATINATAFAIKVNLQPNSNNIRNIEIKTLAKIGYGVGGDDIDYGLIQMIYNIPSIKAAIPDPENHQLVNKESLIELARELKLKIIDFSRGKKPVEFGDASVFYGHIRSRMLDIDKDLNIPAEKTDEDDAYLTKQFKERAIMSEYVFRNVGDAIVELLSSFKMPYNDIELIMSGRSILYPGIKETVLGALKKMGHKCDKEWDGFKVDGVESDQLVKTAVAKGACWYAMYSTRIEMHHDILTSTFGYIDSHDNEKKFVPLLMTNTEFDENGVLESRQAKPLDEGLSNVKFVQMLGNKFEDILVNDIKHKYNVLDEVSQRQIYSMIEWVRITVDNLNNFKFEVKVAGQEEPVTEGRYGNRQIKIEITDENSKSYVFSTTNLLTVDDDAEDDTKINLTKKSDKAPANPKPAPKPKDESRRTRRF